MPGYIGGTVKQRGKAAMAAPPVSRAQFCGFPDSNFEGAIRPLTPIRDSFRLTFEGDSRLAPSLGSQSSDFERIDRPTSAFGDCSEYEPSEAVLDDFVTGEFGPRQTVWNSK